MEKLVTEPIIQYGFLGLSAVLLVIIIWLIKQLLRVIDANNRIIAANTKAIAESGELVRDLLKVTRATHDLLISRPCIALRQIGVMPLAGIQDKAGEE